MQMIISNFVLTLLWVLLWHWLRCVTGLISAIAALDGKQYNNLRAKLHSLANKVSTRTTAAGFSVGALMINTSPAFAKSSLNRPFPSYPLPLFQSESTCKTFHMKICSTFTSIFMPIKVIFIWMGLHKDSIWNWGKRQLRNGLYPAQ